MADTATPNAPVASTPATPNSPAVNSPLAASPVVETPKVETAKPDNELIRQLTKSSAAERKATALAAKLQADLTAATGSATESQQKAKLLDDIKSDPSKLLDLGITWDQMLEAIQGKQKAPVDPKMTELEKQIKDINDREKAREDAANKASEDKLKAANAAEVARGQATIKGILDKEGILPDADGFARWSIISQDPRTVELAMTGVVEFVNEQATKAKAEGKKFIITDKEADDLVRQALDQMEAAERLKFKPLLEKARETFSVKNAKVPSKPTTIPRPELPARRVTVDEAKPRKTQFPTTTARG